MMIILSGPGDMFSEIEGTYGGFYYLGSSGVDDLEFQFASLGD